MSSKRILVVMIAVLVALTAAVSFAADQPAKAKKTATPEAKKAEAAKEAEKAPRLTIIEPVKDYGTVPKGEKLSWTFAIKNTGTSDLQIIAARPACGCTVADFDKVIKPGETRAGVSPGRQPVRPTGPAARNSLWINAPWLARRRQPMRLCAALLVSVASPA